MGKGNFFFGGGNGQCDVTYRENVALWCRCSVPVAKQLASSAVGIAQLAHAAGKSILSHEGCRLWEELVTVTIVFYRNH